MRISKRMKTYLRGKEASGQLGLAWKRLIIEMYLKQKGSSQVGQVKVIVGFLTLNNDQALFQKTLVTGRTNNQIENALVMEKRKEATIGSNWQNCR